MESKGISVFERRSRQLLYVTEQGTDDKAKMASADRSCSSAPLLNGPNMGREGEVVHL